MSTPANIRELAGPHAARPTVFRPGQSGNPAGRAPGTRNRTTVDAREAAARIVDDPEYRERLRRRMIDGTAGAMEPLMWYYAKGKPVERVEHRPAGPLTDITNHELRERLACALRDLDAKGRE